MQDSGNVAAKSGQLWVYNPDMQNVQSFDLSNLPDQNNGGALTGLQTTAAGSLHTVNLTVPVGNIALGGNYRFYLHLVDGHSSSYKGANGTATISTEEKSATDKNGKMAIDGAISYRSTGTPNNGIFLSWAHRQFNVHRMTKVVSPAQSGAAYNWVAPLLNGQSNPWHGKYVSQQIESAINGIFHTDNYYPGDPPDLIAKVQPIGEIQMNSVWKTYAPLDVTKGKKHRWAFSMADTGNVFNALRMVPSKDGTYYTVSPSLPKSGWGFSDMAPLIINKVSQAIAPEENKLGQSFYGPNIRTAIAWTDKGDFFIVVSTVSQTWQTMQSFFQSLPTSGLLSGYGPNPIGPISYAFMLDGSGSSQLDYVENTVYVGNSTVATDNAYHGNTRYIASLLELQWP